MWEQRKINFTCHTQSSTSSFGPEHADSTNWLFWACYFTATSSQSSSEYFAISFQNHLPIFGWISYFLNQICSVSSGGFSGAAVSQELRNSNAPTGPERGAQPTSGALGIQQTQGRRDWDQSKAGQQADCKSQEEDQDLRGAVWVAKWLQTLPRRQARHQRAEENVLGTDQAQKGAET